MFRRLALSLAALVAAGGLVAAPSATPAAHAADLEGSLVFIRNGNVWVAEPDGTGQRQVTTGGGYESPSMSDDGRIAAIRGDDLVVMWVDGTRIAQFEPPTLFIEGSCSTIHETPPVEAAISPDGTKIVWSQLRSSNCNGRIEIDARTAITNANRYALRGLVLGEDPSWVGNGKVLLDDNGTLRLMDVDHDGPKAHDWFDSYDLWGTYYDLNAPTVTRDGSRVAYLVDRPGSTELVIDHPTTGNPHTTNAPGVPSATNCQAQAGSPRPDDGPILDDLMFSPDGTALVHAEGNEIWTITGLPSGCEQRTFTKILDGVNDVFWSAYTLGTPIPDTASPTVRITGVEVRSRTAAVSFRGSDNATSARQLAFQCQLDGGAKRACASPQAYRRLKPGAHTVKVWAVDRAGNVSAAASTRFRVGR